MTNNRDHEWSNSVGEKLFLRLLEAVTPHYSLWVSFSTAGDIHQPGSSHLYIQEVGRTTRSRSNSSRSRSPALSVLGAGPGATHLHLKPLPLRLADLDSPKPPAWLLLPPDTWVRLKLSVPDIVIYNTKDRVTFVWELKMYARQVEAEEQLKTCIFITGGRGCWRWVGPNA